LSTNTEAVIFRDVSQWESWLAEHYEQSNGLWLLIAKKGSQKVSLTISDALDAALCYGWIAPSAKAV
jgi:uncharacterized protein YdeI (YjbR/CyaY-like superfamily)